MFIVNEIRIACVRECLSVLVSLNMWLDGNHSLSELILICVLEKDATPLLLLTWEMTHRNVNFS